MPLPSPVVSARRAPPGAIADAVAAALEDVEWRAILDGHEHVLVKPNLGYDLPAAGACTSPEVLEALVRLLVRHGHRVTIIEGDQVLVRVERAAARAGVPALCTLPGVSWLELTRAPASPRSLPGARVLDGVRLPDILREAPLISVPVMKTHAKCQVTGALKNQWGLLPIDRHHLHPVLDDALADLYRLAPPRLCLLDATVCMEGDGPKSGRPRRLDHVFAAHDAFTLDWLTTALMGFDPSGVPYLDTIRRDLGLTPRPEVRGALPTVAPFAPARHNLVSRLETVLRDSPLAPVVFHGPVFAMACHGARLWYRAGSVLERATGRRPAR